MRRLYEAGSDLVVVPLQDLFGWTDRINLPMTQSSENWNYQLPFELGMDGEVPRGLEDEGAILGGFVESAGR